MKNFDKEKKLQFFAVFVAFLTIIVLAGVTYTFFASAVSNTNNEKFSTSTATLSLVFADGDNGISASLNLGESITKKFTIQNTGTKDSYGKINWVDLVNTYTQGSLTWTLEQSTSENGTYTTVGSGAVPTASSNTTAQLQNGLLVPIGATYYYKLTITLNNLDVNQNSDLNANMHSKFSLQNGQELGYNKILNLVSGSPTNTTDVITKTAPAGASCTNTLAYDGTSDNNLRYVGANPCNYVTFNGETAGWRIIGVMNNVYNEGNTPQTRIKLIRASSIGEYSLDTSAAAVNSGYGINDWSQADLMTELNTDFFSYAASGTSSWYNGRSNAKTGTYNLNYGLNNSALSLIEDAKWYLGGNSNTVSTLIPSSMYTAEKGTNVWGSTSGQNCTDSSCPRATTYTGKVGIMYPSDYGFATAGGATTSRTTCITTLGPHSDTTGNTWTNASNANCKDNDWIKPASGYEWTMSPNNADATNGFILYYSGIIGTDRSSNSRQVRPTLYLKSDVTILGGTGDINNPYTIG